MKVPNIFWRVMSLILSLPRLQNEGSQLAAADSLDFDKSIKATE